jgi:phosphate transport system permease protein
VSHSNPSILKSADSRYRGAVFHALCFAATWVGLLVLLVLLAGVLWQAWGWLDWSFLNRFDSRYPERAGVKAGLWGSVWLVLLTAMFSVPIGVGAALYLEEYAKDSLIKRTIQVNIANLAGVPSIVYGILGLTIFVRMWGLFEPSTLVVNLWFAKLRVPFPLGRSVLSGALTLSLLILPVVIVAAQEALRSIPSSLRHGAYALGATQWQTIRHQVLPPAIPGILTGVILALSRAIGETAPLVMIGALTYIAFTPGSIEHASDLVRNPQAVVDAPFSLFTAMPILIFNWVSQPKSEFQHVAAAAIVVLLAILLILNATAVLVRHRFQNRIRW